MRSDRADDGENVPKVTQCVLGGGDLDVADGCCVWDRRQGGGVGSELRQGSLADAEELIRGAAPRADRRAQRASVAIQLALEQLVVVRFRQHCQRLRSERALQLRQYGALVRFPAM